MAYLLKKDRVDFLNENVVYTFGGSDTEPQPRELYELMSYPWEIHYFVSQYNWDNDPTVLTWIIDNPLCDKATALMIFWRAAPASYTIYATQAEADAQYEGPIYKLVRDIIAKWESNFFQHHQIAYIPLIDDEFEVTYRVPKEKEKWSIPDSMREPLSGEELIVEK